VVYLAEAPSGARVAIKQLLVDDEGELDRKQLAKEVVAARRVAPFCTAQLLDAQLEGPEPYLVSEYIPGPTLSRKIRQDGPMSGTALQRMAIGTVTALAAIHQAGIVHRDFKPANVMLSQEGPRVIDFGIARDLATEMTETSRVIGTPAYMAPEQLRNEPVGPAADMFAWASVIAYTATGRAPFDADHVMAVAHRILNEEPSLGGVPAGLRTVLERCLLKDPADRPTAEQALAMLLGRPEPEVEPELLVRGSRIAEALAAVPLPAQGPERRWRRGMTQGDRIALLGVLICVVAVGGWAITQGDRRDRPAGPAQLLATGSPVDGSATSERPGPDDTGPAAGVSGSGIHSSVRKKTPKADPVAKDTPRQAVTPSSTPKRPSSATGTGPILGIAGKCLDVVNAWPGNGTVVQLTACNQTKAQIWSAERDGTIQALGKCLNVAGGRVEINECDGTGDQSWQIASGVIVNVGSGRCLAPLGGDSADRTPTVVTRCSGADSQSWSLRA
jgi:hypothetical protein